MTPDGNRIAYRGIIDRITPDSLGISSIYLHDRNEGTTILVSSAIDGTNSPGAQAFNPILTPDGRYVFFGSDDPAARRR